MGKGQAQHVPHGHAHRAPVERIRGTGAQQHRIHAHAGGMAEDGADIFMIAHALEHGDGLGGFHDLAHLRLRGAVRGSDQPAVHIEAGYLR